MTGIGGWWERNQVAILDRVQEQAPQKGHLSRVGEDDVWRSLFRLDTGAASMCQGREYTVGRKKHKDDAHWWWRVLASPGTVGT